MNHLSHIPSLTPEILGGDNYLKESVDLLQRLIRCHPVYNSTGQTEALSEVETFLRKFRADRLILDNFTAEDIKDNPLYVAVESFAGIYSDYRLVPKRNLIAYIESDSPGPTLILNGHIDVDLVSTPGLWEENHGWRSGTVKDGKVFGRGATDMLGGLCGLLCAAARLASNKSKWCGRIIITIVCDEEIGGNGTLRALEVLKKSGDLSSSYGVHAIIAEPTQGAICNVTLGFSPFSISLSRRTVHMGLSTEQGSLFEDLFRIERDLLKTVIKTIAQSFASIKVDHFRCNYGILQGGIDPALPLGSLTIEGTFFIPPTIEKNVLLDSIRASLKSMLRPGTDFDVKLGDMFFPGSCVNDSPLLSALTNNSQDIGGPQLFPSPCDARLFESYGVPCLVFGPGSLIEAHAVDESISLSELRTYTENVEAGIKKFLSYGE